MASRGRQPQKRRSSTEEAVATFKATRSVLVIFILMVFLGFPGTLSKVIGKGAAKLIETASFGLQFVLVMLASGDDVMNLKLVDLKASYWIPYSFLVYIVADSVLVSIDRKMVIISVVHLVLTAVFALWLIEQYSPEELMELLYAAVFLTTAIVLIGMVIFHGVVLYNYHGSPTLRGMFSTKNEYGIIVCYGILTQVVLLRMRLNNGQRLSLLFIGTLIAQFFMLLLTRNMGSLLSTLVILAYMMYYSNQKKKKRLPVGLLFIVVSFGFLFFALTVLQALGPFLESLGKDASLTGRVPLWERCITIMGESHTLTGYGYLMFWRTPAAAAYFRSGFDPNSWAGRFSASMHNFFMEMWVDNGLIGIVLLLLMLLTADRGIKYLTDEQYLFISAFFTEFTVSMLTERGMDSGSIFTMTLFMSQGMMYQAKFQHKIDVQRKARIYVMPDAEHTPIPSYASTVGGELSAFQERFSNMADQQKKSTAHTPQKGLWDEPETKKKTLDDLFSEIGGDDW